MPRIEVGDKVKWTTSRKPLGIVIRIFVHREKLYAVVEDDMQVLTVVRIYEKLEKC